MPSALWKGSLVASEYLIDLLRYDTPARVGREHADILEVTHLLEHIQNILERNVDILPQYISRSIPPLDNRKRLRFTLHSPLSLHLYDAVGNHTGYTTTAGALEQQISESRYQTFGELQHITVPAQVGLRLELRGYASGSFTLDVEELEGNLVLASTTFAAIPTSTSTIATLTLRHGTLVTMSALSLDYDGDGLVDVTFEPKLGEIVLPDVVPKCTFSGFLPPITSNGTAIHKFGSTLPIKFRLTDPDGYSVPNVKATLRLRKVQDGILGGTVALLLSSAANTGALFRYDESNQQYIYNLSTANLSKGIWQISVDLEDWAEYNVIINLR